MMAIISRHSRKDRKIRKMVVLLYKKTNMLKTDSGAENKMNRTWPVAIAFCSFPAASFSGLPGFAQVAPATYSSLSVSFY